MSIRMIEPQDADELMKLVDANRQYLRQWLPWLDCTTEMKHMEGFISRSLHDYADKKGAVFVILDGGKIVGVCGFNLLDWKTGVGEIGYWLSQDCQGSGLMTDSIRQILTYGFGRLGLSLCRIRAATGNRKSRAVAERLGFQHDGILRRSECLYGMVVDHAVYSLLKTEWQANANTK